MFTAVEPSFLNVVLTAPAESKIDLKNADSGKGFQNFLDASMRSGETNRRADVPNADSRQKNEDINLEKLGEKIEKIFEKVMTEQNSPESMQNAPAQDGENARSAFVADKAQQVYKELKDSGLDDEEAGKLTKDLFQLMGVNLDAEKLIASMKDKSGKKIDFLVTAPLTTNNKNIETAARNMKLILPSVTKIMMKLFKTLNPNASDEAGRKVDDLFSTIHKKLITMFARTGLEKKDGDKSKNIVEGNDVLIKDILKKAVEEIKVELKEKNITFDEKKVELFVKNIGSLLVKMAKIDEKNEVKTDGNKINLNAIKIENNETLENFIHSDENQQQESNGELDEEVIKVSAEFKKILTAGLEILKTGDSGSEKKDAQIQKAITDISNALGKKLVSLENKTQAVKNDSQSEAKKKISVLVEELFRNTEQTESGKVTEAGEAGIDDLAADDRVVADLADRILKVLENNVDAAENVSDDAQPLAAMVTEVSEMIRQSLVRESDVPVSEQVSMNVIREVSEKIVTVATSIIKSEVAARKKVDNSGTEIDFGQIRKEIKTLVKKIEKTVKTVDNSQNAAFREEIKSARSQFKNESNDLHVKTDEPEQKGPRPEHSDNAKARQDHFEDLAKKLNVKELHAEVKSAKPEQPAVQVGKVQAGAGEMKLGEIVSQAVQDQSQMPGKNGLKAELKSEQWNMGIKDARATRQEIMTEVRDRFVSRMEELKDGAVQFGKNQIRVKLSPDNLGELKIELTMTEKGLSAKISSDRPEVRQMLESTGAALRQNFSQKGINLHEFVVSMKENSFYQNQEQEQKNKWSSRKNNAVEEDEEEAVEALDLDALKEIFKAQKLKMGGVDYWI